MKRLPYHSRWVTGLAAALALSASSASGWVTLGEHNWNDGDLKGWKSDDAYTTVSIGAGIGPDASDALLIDYASGLGQVETLVYTYAGNLFAGDWNVDGLFVAFDFWAEDVQPTDLEFQFMGDSGTEWRYDFTPPSLNTWTHFTVWLDHSTDWTYGNFGAGNAQDFKSDLASIDWIGVWMGSGQEADGNYGLDDFKLQLPEPGEYAMAGAALLVLALALRKHRVAAGASWRARRARPANG